MRRFAFATRLLKLSRTGPLAIAMLSGMLLGTAAAEQEYEETGRSTVEVTVPKPARRSVASATRTSPGTRRTVAASTRDEREVVYESSEEMPTRTRTMPQHRSVATRRPPAPPARRIEAYEADPRSSGRARYPYTQTAMHRASARMQPPVMEEVAPGGEMSGPAMQQGEVIYDDYQGGPMAGDVIQGDFGNHPTWDGGAPYLPDIWHHKRWGITAGAEALFMRSHYSQGMGLQSTTGTQPGNTALVNINGLNWPGDYVGAFRGYLGIRNLDCGDELRVSYWNFGNTENMSATSTTSTEYCDFLCNQTANPGDTINTSLNLQANVFDLDMIKSFCVPQPCMPACDSCDSCGDCDSCGSCGPCCPVWDVRWFAGLRFAQINHTLASTINSADGTQVVNASSVAKFGGVGPRIGTQVRRYFDHAARWSIYGRGATSLLVGNLNQTISNFNVTAPPTLVTQTDSFNRVIPVLDVEVGASWCVTQRITLSGGWLVMAWWDLGLQERVQDFDTSNILGFDGFFFRGEMVF